MDSSLLFQLFYTKSTIIISVFVTDIRNIENKTELYKFGKQMCQLFKNRNIKFQT